MSSEGPVEGGLKSLLSHRLAIFSAPLLARPLLLFSSFRSEQTPTNGGITGWERDSITIGHGTVRFGPLTNNKIDESWSLGRGTIDTECLFGSDPLHINN